MLIHISRARIIVAMVNVLCLISWIFAVHGHTRSCVEREAAIRPLAEQQRLCTQDVAEAVRHLRIGRSVLYKLVHRYRQRPSDGSTLRFVGLRFVRDLNAVK
jgi:hypothetical protein